MIWLEADSPAQTLFLIYSNLFNHLFQTAAIIMSRKYLNEGICSNTLLSERYVTSEIKSFAF